MSGKDIEKLLMGDNIETSNKTDGADNLAFSDQLENKSRLRSLNMNPRIKKRLMRSAKAESIELSSEEDSIQIDSNQMADENKINASQIDSIKDIEEGEEIVDSLNADNKKTYSGIRQISKNLSKLRKLRPGLRSEKPQNVSHVRTDSQTIVNNENNQILRHLNEENTDPTTDANSILNIKIHSLEHFESIKKIVHPIIQIHIIDSMTGKYLSKKHMNRCVTSYYENSRVDYIMPVMTKPSHNIQNACLIWAENILYNEDYNYLVKEGILFFFEIIEFKTINDSNKSSEKFWKRIGWAFLRPISDEYNHTGHRVRLQLYKPVLVYNSNTKHLETTELYIWWKSKKLTAIIGTLSVTLESETSLSLNLEPTLRSFFPFQSEISIKSSSKLIDENNTQQNFQKMDTLDKKILQKDQILLWNRIEGQSCKIPKTRWHSLTGSGRGCFCLKFSNDGRKMSCASPINSSNEYSIFIYEIPSTNLLSHFGHHNGIIYELDWTQDNRSLLSASNDCTAKVWRLNDNNECISYVLLPHPCFLYSAKFHVKNFNVVLTAGFDGVIRVWNISDSNQTELIQELNSFNGSILCMSWNYTNYNEFEIFCGSDDGIIKAISQNDNQWKISSTLIIKDLKNVSINSIAVHPTGNKLILFCRDGIHRMIDYKLQIITQVYKGSINVSHLIRGSLSACGQLVFISSEDSSVLVWKAETGERIHTYYDVGLNGLITYVEYHPFDHMLAVCGLDSSASILLYRFVHQNNKTRLNPRLNPIEGKDKIQIPSNLRKQFQNAMHLLDDIIK